MFQSRTLIKPHVGCVILCLLVLSLKTIFISQTAILFAFLVLYESLTVRSLFLQTKMYYSPFQGNIRIPIGNSREMIFVIMQKRDESKTKEFVDVVARHSAGDASIMPISITRDDGTTYEVMRVLDVCRAASLRAGGLGMRYFVRLYQEESDRCISIYLFDDAGYWFIEKTEDGYLVLVPDPGR